jgi:hypothetical protein
VLLRVNNFLTERKTFIILKEDKKFKNQRADRLSLTLFLFFLCLLSFLKLGLLPITILTAGSLKCAD